MILPRGLLSTLFLCGLALFLPPELSLLSEEPPANRNDVIRTFRAAQEDMQAGHLSSAIAEFKRVLQLQPDLIEARVNLGLAYHARGDYSLAASELGRAAKQRPDLLPASLFLGLSYLKLGFPEKAIAPLDRALAIDSSNREARRALATAELSEGYYGKAANQFRRLAAAQTDKAEAWFTLGQGYLEMAKQLTAELSERYRNSAWSLRLAGDVLGERHLWNDAAFAYRKALETEPAQAGLHSALGEALLRAGKTEEAESEFRAELAYHAFEPSALLGVAQVSLLKGAARPALEPLAKVWKSSPDRLAQAEPDFPLVDPPPDSARRMTAELGSAPPGPAREFLLSALLRISGDTVGANEARLRFANAVKSAVTSDRKSAPLSRSACDEHHDRLCAKFLASQKQLRFPDLLRLGRTLYILRQDDAASDALAAALAGNKASPEVLYWLNRSYLRLTADCFNQLTASYPDSWRAHELKGEALHLRQADKDAIVEYHAAERLNPDSPGIHEALGELLLEDNVGQAKSELETALQINPAAARSLYLLGRLYVSERDPAKGIPYLEAALRYNPTLLEARPVLGKAYLKVGKADLAVVQLERSTSLDRYGDLHYLLYQAYREAGKPQLASEALARSQELRRRSAAEDQAKIWPTDRE